MIDGSRRWMIGLAVALAAASAGCGAGENEGAQAAEQEVAAEIPQEAADQVTLHYATHQEFIEMYYGPAGRLNDGNQTLGDAVEASEARYHELMQLLSAEKPPTRAELDRAAEALRTAHDRVLTVATEAGVPLEPTSDVLQGTPEGGLEDWIGDIHAAVAGLSAGEAA